MQTVVNETQLKVGFKTALVEGMEDRRDLIRAAALEALDLLQKSKLSVDTRLPANEFAAGRRAAGRPPAGTRCIESA